MFRRGRHYTRREIHDHLGGGSLQTYLPSKEGHILCACLRLDTNPDAPEVILPGTGPGIEEAARRLRRQRGPLPVFIKAGSGAWRFEGMYEVEPKRWTQDDIDTHSRRSGRTDITSVIWMTPAVVGERTAGPARSTIRRRGARHD